jgi:tRNA nucleotidyltransferase/poly(A) polymerase
MIEIANDTEAAKRDNLRKYNREYYHAHKKESDCQYCSKTFSSLRALRRHQGRNLKCQLTQARQELQQAKGSAAEQQGSQKRATEENA